MIFKRLTRFLTLCTVLIVANPAWAVYISDVRGNLFNLDVTNNSSTLIGNSGIGALFDIALDPTSGNLYGVTGFNQFASINTSTGAATIISNNTGSFINGLTFDSTGTLYGSGSNQLFTIDISSGSASVVGTTGFISSGDLAFDSNGNLFMSAATTDSTDLLISVNSSTGAGSLIGDIGFSDVFGLNFSGSTLYGFTSNGLTLTIDTATGAGSQLAGNGIAAYGAASVGDVAPIPEPSVIALFATGLIGMGLMVRRRTRQC